MNAQKECVKCSYLSAATLKYCLDPSNMLISALLTASLTVGAGSNNSIVNKDCGWSIYDRYEASEQSK